MSTRLFFNLYATTDINIILDQAQKLRNVAFRQNICELYQHRLQCSVPFLFLYGNFTEAIEILEKMENYHSPPKSDR